MLHTVLENNNIVIAAIVDKLTPIVFGITCFSNVDEVADVIQFDAIVVTPLKDADEIANELRKNVRCHVVTIEELLNG